MAIELRLATEFDLDTLSRMVRAYYMHDGLAYEELPARRALHEIIRTKRFGRAWLIDLDKELIGYAVLTFGFSVEFYGRHAVLDEVFLLPDHQGKGYFRKILALIEACCRDRESGL
jgi:diamine N-acetyltransferase